MSKWFTNKLEIKTHTKKVDPSCDNQTRRANNALIKKYENYFLKQEIDYLKYFQHESNHFYGLPKSSESPKQ